MHTIVALYGSPLWRTCFHRYLNNLAIQCFDYLLKLHERSEDPLILDLNTRKMDFILASVTKFYGNQRNNQIAQVSE
jgi:hypothetical protein